MFSTSPHGTSHVMIKRNCQRITALAVSLLIVLSGCSKGNGSEQYVVPDDIYEVTFEHVPFKEDTYQYSRDEIASGEPFERDDLQFIVNEDLTLQMGNVVDVTPWEFVTEYDYGSNGKIKEYKEVTGNYKVLLSEKEGNNYLIAILTLSKYMKTQRGIRNGLNEEALDILVGNATFVTKESKRQISRIYTVDGYKLIITLKDGIVRSIQMISGEY